MTVPHPLITIAKQNVQGDSMWQTRKRNEADDLDRLLSQLPDGRLQLVHLDLRERLRVVLNFAVPLPMRPEKGQLPLADHAIVGLLYPRELLLHPIPSTSVAVVLHPDRDIFHPNIGGTAQQLCFGTSIPAAIPLRELIIWTHGLLCLQNIMMDPGNAAGVMNRQAAQWWQANTHRIPLTSQSLLAAADPAENRGVS